MVSTRLASPSDPCGLPRMERRGRVDPVKLLDLIARIKSASGGQPAPVGRATPKPSARTGCPPTPSGKEMEMFDKMIRLGGASVLAVTVSGCSSLQIPSFAPQSQAAAPVPAATAPAPTPVRGNDNPFHRDDDDDDDSGGGGGGGNDDNDSGWG